MIHGHNFNRTFSGQAGECDGLNRKTFYSTDIYDAVFEHGISTFEGLKNFINSKYEKQLIR